MNVFAKIQIGTQKWRVEENRATASLIDTNLCLFYMKSW